MCRRPLNEIARLVAVNREHPYARLQDVLEESLDFFRQICIDSGCHYLDNQGGNWLLPTALGTVRPTYLAPASMAVGDLSKVERILVVGFRELKDFYPEVLTSNLKLSGELKPGCGLNTGVVSAGGGELHPGALAHRLEQPDIMNKVISQVKPFLSPGSVVLFPPVLGVRRNSGVARTLAEGLDSPVYEVTGIPPALPGQRLQQALFHHLKVRGVEVIIGCTVTGSDISGKRCLEITAIGGGGTLRISARTFVLATGSFLGGGLEARPEKVYETIFNLPVKTTGGKWSAREGAALRDRLMARVEWLGKAGRLFPALVNWCGRIRPLRWLGEKIFGLSAEMTLPRYAGRTFYELYNHENSSKKQVRFKRTVVYYPGCYVNYNTPEVGLALEEVMARNGIRVLVEKFNCCGLPLISNGFLAEAKSYARRNIKQLRDYADRGCPIITSCPSCNLALRREYRELFDLEDTGQLSDKIIDVFEYLQFMAQQGELDTGFYSLPLRMGYHQPYHLKAGGCGVPSQKILGLIPDLQVCDLDAGCCGLSGSCGFKREKYSNSMEIGREVFRAINDMGVKQVITECGICQLQIHHGTGAAVYQPIQVLAEAYGLGSLSK